jgi:hypothetical protein
MKISSESKDSTSLTIESTLEYPGDQILIYFFCNGRNTTEKEAYTFLLACALTDCKYNGELIARVMKRVQEGKKIVIRLPNVSSSVWEKVIEILCFGRVSQMHEGKKTIFRKNRYDELNPNIPDLLMAIVLGVDQSDIEKAFSLLKSGEI